MSNNAKKARICLNPLQAFFQRSKSKSAQQFQKSFTEESISIVEDDYDTLSSEEEEELFFPRVIMKPLGEIDKLKKIMVNSLLFSNPLFTGKRINVLAYALERVEGEVDERLKFFIVEKGIVHITESNKERTLKTGDCFGDINILNNIQTSVFFNFSDDCVIWSLDKFSFDSLVRTIISPFLQNTLPILTENSLMKGLSFEEKHLLLYGSHLLEIHEKEILFRNGDMPFFFYILVEGKVEEFSKSDEDEENEFQGLQGNPEVNIEKSSILNNFRSQ